ncbi:hypothetical protein [Paracoccus sp. DMF]|uniref:hypothetical protein n=1 Tax=Paracoccus sp. DMF TaxID=400837 RepID=UPI0021E3E2A2|nr:hypothetical protein [Paracoccus sp. DMF]MCV2446994.1 hypothetical protein [Paracoccus sp. DMF]
MNSKLWRRMRRRRPETLRDLQRRAGNDPGLTLVGARIARGLAEKELARKLGLKEQQIHRDEDSYNS